MPSIASGACRTETRKRSGRRAAGTGWAGG
jgi:hypothetical protein